LLVFDTSLPLTSTHLLKMNFQFLLQGTPIEKEEAAALFKATQSAKTDYYPIDLEKVIDLKVIDSKKLFDLAVEKKIPDLASLAFKVSLATNSNASKPRVRNPNRIARRTARVRGSSSEEIIELLNQTSSYWATGAASILLETSSTEWCTLREIAINIVNMLDRQTRMPKNSVLYRGFTQTDEGWEPLDFSYGVERKNTFHVSPVYIGLREGLLWCVKNGLVEQKSLMSVTPTNESNKGTMSRIFYKIKATENANSIVGLWADLPNYIESFYRARRMA